MEQDENYYTDYAQGIKDCREGNRSPDNATDRYLDGYSDQFTLEAVISHG